MSIGFLGLSLPARHVLGEFLGDEEAWRRLMDSSSLWGLPLLQDQVKAQIQWPWRSGPNARTSLGCCSRPWRYILNRTDPSPSFGGLCADTRVEVCLINFVCGCLCSPEMSDAFENPLLEEAIEVWNLDASLARPFLGTGSSQVWPTHGG